MKIYLASGNLHKKYEMQEVFRDFEIIIPKEVGINFNPIENGNTFMANSLLKAEQLFNIINGPVLADDSGICVDAIDGKPGIYSARYAGKNLITNYNENLSSEERNKLLIDEVNEILNSQGKKISDLHNRTCRFVCALTFYYGKDKFITVQETLEGYLVTSIENANGSGGFGYDPIVYLKDDNKTVAELSEKEKNDISHRGKACKKMLYFL